MDRKETSFTRSPESRTPRPAKADSPSSVGKFVVFYGKNGSFPDLVSFSFEPQTNSVQTEIKNIVPMDLHHPILREFPEHREVSRRLKGSSDHFRSVFDEYQRLDDEIYRIEEEIDFATDQEIEELKMRRAKLKDYIYHIIRHAPPVMPGIEVAAASVAATARATVAH
jgi:uncharacterized protein YdcH (DUF465 family)